MAALYRFGVLVVVFGGFLALNSTGFYATVGIYSMLIGFLIGIIGLLQPSLRASE
ncbi:hypothetical protein [Halorubrum distributum]|uniref:hypothetical protein n=1 Tax=Halorubrum distributum TaxID=29283 RepID=UPI0013763735|nr:hypothetical protein [Halorubrum arcis]